MRVCLQRTDFMRTSTIASLHSIWLYKGKYNWKFICNILSILMEGDRRTGNWPPAEVLPKERLAQRLRYCRIMPMKHRNAPAWTPGQGETAPWTARFDGFVGHRYPIKHNSYSIFAVQRSSRERVFTCLSRGMKPRPTVSSLRQRGSSLHAFAQRLPPQICITLQY